MRHDSLWHVCSGCCYQCTTRSRWHLTLQGMLTSSSFSHVDTSCDTLWKMCTYSILLQHRFGMFWLMSRHANDVSFSGATWCCNCDVIAMLLPSANASDLMLHRDTTKDTSGPTRRYNVRLRQSTLLDQRLLHQATKSAAAMRYNVPAAYG